MIRAAFLRDKLIFRNIFHYTIEFYERACEAFVGCALAPGMLDEAGPMHLLTEATSCIVGLLVQRTLQRPY